MKFLVEYLKENISTSIMEKLSKNLENEKNRLWHRYAGLSVKDFWKKISSEKPAKVYSHILHFKKLNLEMFDRLKDKYDNDLIKFITEYQDTYGANLFKDIKFLMNVNDSLKDDNDIKDYLLSDEVMNNLNDDANTSDLKYFQQYIDGFDWDKSKIEYIETVKDCWCCHFMTNGKENDGTNYRFDKKNDLDNFLSILKTGFKYGSPCPEKITNNDEIFDLYKSLGKKKVEGGINFAYELDKASRYNFKDISDIGGRKCYSTKYGNIGFIFKIEDGIKILHRDDENEEQIMFTADNITSKIIPLYTSYKENIFNIISNCEKNGDELNMTFEKEFDSWEKLVKYITEEK